MSAALSLKDNPMAKQIENEHWYCKCCVKCLCSVFLLAIILIIIGSALAFIKDSPSENRRVGFILLGVGILLAILILICLFCLIRTFMRYERRINNPEPFVAPKEGYPKQEYQ